MLATLLEQVGDSFILEEILYHLESDFERAEEDETYYKGLVELSQHYRKIGAIDIAIALLVKLYHIAPRNKVIYLLAQLHYDMSDYEQAVQWLALLSRPLTAYKPLLLQSKLYIALEQYASAKQVLKDLMEQFPTQASAYHLLAEVYEKQGLYEQAERYYRIVYDYFKDQVDAHAIRFKLIELAIFHKEILSMQEVVALFPEEVANADEAYLLALAHYKAENLMEAMDYAQFAIELATDFMDAHFLLLELYSQSEDIAGVHQELKWLTQAIPPYDAMIADLVPFAVLAHYYADELCDKVIDYYPLCEDLDERYQLLHYIVSTFLQKNSIKDAEEVLERLSGDAFDPTDLARLHQKIAQAKLNAERDDK